MQRDDTPPGRCIWGEHVRALHVMIVTFNNWFFEVLQIVVAQERSAQ